MWSHIYIFITKNPLDWGYKNDYRGHRNEYPMLKTRVKAAKMVPCGQVWNILRRGDWRLGGGGNTERGVKDAPQRWRVVPKWTQVSFIHMGEILWEQGLGGRCMCCGTAKFYLIERLEHECMKDPFRKTGQRGYHSQSSGKEKEHPLSGTFPEKKREEKLQACQEESKTKPNNNNKTPETKPKHLLYFNHIFNKGGK